MRFFKDLWVHAFGSDELSPYSALYSWLANQMAHAMMGFAIATLVILLALNHTKPPALDYWVIGLFMLIPVKEIVDVTTDRLNSRSSIDLNLRRMIFDSVTDIGFWWIGMFLAALIVGLFTASNFRWIIPVLGLGACAAFLFPFAAPRWMDQKRVFDLSALPMGFKRLVMVGAEQQKQFEKEGKPYFAGDQMATWRMLEELRSDVVGSEGKPRQRHIVIFGGTPDARFELCVALGCEYALRLRPSKDRHRTNPVARTRYNTAVAGLELPESFKRFSPELLECVVIDDLDVSLEWVVRLAEQTKGKVQSLQADAAVAPSAGTPSDKGERLLQLGNVVQKHGISTIWVLAGRRDAEWERNKDKWIEFLTEMLGATPIMIQLADAAADSKEKTHGG